MSSRATRARARALSSRAPTHARFVRARRAQAAEIEELRQRRERVNALGREELAHSEAMLRHVRWAVDELSSDAGITVAQPPAEEDDGTGGSREGAPEWLVSAVERAR